MSPHISLDGLDMQVKMQQKSIDRMLDIQEAQVTVNNNLETSIRLMQQAHADFMKNHETEMANLRPKIRTLWDNRSQIKGGYVVIATLGGIIVGGASVGALFVNLFKHQ